eukprot:2950679-Lingulodinium_polyedra.AAC.1
MPSHALPTQARPNQAKPSLVAPCPATCPALPFHATKRRAAQCHAMYNRAGQCDLDCASSH